jgi:HAD superfamily hydrolase (TIGR01484 family)
MHDIKLIALDLDGTLLNSRKELTKENYEALEKAAAAGIEIVPCTGRVYSAMPEVVRNLPFVNYIILVTPPKSGIPLHLLKMKLEVVKTIPRPLL